MSAPPIALLLKELIDSPPNMDEEAHQDLMDAVAQKMTDLGVPTAELGFAPLQTSALQTSVFQQSRVPSQRRQTVVQDQLPVQTASLEVSGAHAASPVQVAMPQAV